MEIQDLSYATINSLSPLYHIINKMNRYIGKSNEKKYLMLVPSVEYKETLKMYYELWNKTGALIRSITNNSDIQNERFVKIKLNSDDYSPLDKILELYSLTIIGKSVIHKGNTYYPKDFLRECLYKL